MTVFADALVTVKESSLVSIDVMTALHAVSKYAYDNGHDAEDVMPAFLIDNDLYATYDDYVIAVESCISDGFSGLILDCHGNLVVQINGRESKESAIRTAEAVIKIL